MVHSLYAVHNPLQAPQALIDKYKLKKDNAYVPDINRFTRDEAWMQFEPNWKNRIIQDNAVYAAMIENMDWNIGRMIHKLKELNLLENTVIIFTSDNGGLSTAEGSPTSNSPLRAGKGWLYEGGIRVPFIIYWKGKSMAGTVSDLPVHTADIFPTLAKIVNKNYKKTAEIDGDDIFRIMTKPKKYRKRNIIWHYPHYSNQGGKPSAAIREGKFKLIYYFETGSTELFNLDNDMGEQKNIGDTNKSKASTLKKKLFRWLKQNNGFKLSLNSGYKP